MENEGLRERVIAAAEAALAAESSVSALDILGREHQEEGGGTPRPSGVHRV
jgi:hypothetical protein